MPWLLIILLLAVAAIIAIVKLLPWWGSLILFAIPILGWKYIVAFIFGWMVRRTALDLAKALADADYEVHVLKAVPPPDPAVLEEFLKDEGGDEGDEEFEEAIKDMPDEPPEARNWFKLECTIRPELRPDEEGERQSADWDPSALMLVKPGLSWGEIDDECQIVRVEMKHEGRFQKDLHAYGPARVRLLLGVKPGTDRLVFRYMFAQEFGSELQLPPPLEKSS